ncbi:conjugative transposon protein TcpC [Nonomuraea polychroma]|uniref:Conjugative transposon protein TcpC n=2 Tax=Nonomuraea polychroma TaxID=46176 RepID=A0A438MFR7_9ACTN|nr:conjugative transposon protein TcpC [Nonomuraea polychroma]
MARRSTVQHDPRIADGPGLSATLDTADFDAPPPRRPRRGGWSGGGGRWLVWTGRIILWALIVVIVVNGIRAPFERFTQQEAVTPNGAAVANNGFPVDRGMAFAAQFAGVYLNFSPEDDVSRSRKLAAFLPDASDPRMGWDGLGKLAAVAIQPYDIETTDAQNAVVSVAFQSGPRRLMLSVPIYYAGDEGGKRFVVSGRPAILPAPAPAELPQVAPPETDDAAAAELKPQLEGFFKDYASGDAAGLQRYVAAGKSLPSFGGAFTFAELKKVVVPVGGATREIQAVVVWVVPNGEAQATPNATDPATVGARLEQAYRLTVEKQGDKWFVADIRGAGRVVD